MTPRVSAIVVNHRSAAEAAACVASLREAFAREDVAGEIVLVDCASGPAEVAALAALAADAEVFLPDNRGYSGGVNAGLARARAPRLVISNADVVFLPGAVTALLSEIEDPKVAAAAPLCLWDAAGKLRLPADSATGFFGELGVGRFAPFARRTLAPLGAGGRRAAPDRRRARGPARRVRPRRPLRRAVPVRVRGDRVGGPRPREGPPAALRSGSARPPSLCAQRRAQPGDRAPPRDLAAALPRAALRPARARAARARRGAAAPRVRATALSEPLVRARAGASLAISTNPSLIPFAGASLAEDFRLPEDVLASLRPGPLYLRVFRTSDGRPLETFVWEKR